MFFKHKSLFLFIVSTIAMIVLSFGCTTPGSGTSTTSTTTTTTSTTTTTTSTTTTTTSTTTTTTVAPTAVTFESAVQTGGTSGTADSTGLTLTFSVDPTTLAASDITVTGATKGALSGTGTTRSLAISGIMVGNGETVSVAITSPSGFDLSGSPKTAVVYRYIHDFSSISYRQLVSITGGTYTQTDGTSSFSHTISDFSLGQYEVTYELWYTVYQWAISNGYNFAYAGREGHDGTVGAALSAAPTKYEPVTNINWRDAIVWCNAYSQMSGLTPVYSYSSAVIKNSRYANATACDGAVPNWAANGYRLPTEGEWQYAASNKGATAWNWASGGTGAYTGVTEIDYPNFSPVAWYGNSTTSPNGNTTSTKPVGTTTNPSALTLRDMSGNVWEWCWDWHAAYPGDSTNYRGPASGSLRILRGGGWLNDAYYLRVGLRIINYFPNYVFNYVGFRIARTPN